MGICIGYSGRLNAPSLFEEMVKDLHMVSGSFHWKCTAVELPISGLVFGERKGRGPRLVEETLRGVYVTPPDTETLQLLVDRKGRLCFYQEVPAKFINGPVAPDTSYYMRFPLWVKTTGAFDSHILILVLLERLQRKFMKNLKIDDSTGFWKHHDLERLATEHAAMSLLLDSMNDPAVARMLLRASGADIPDDAIIESLPNTISLPVGKPKGMTAKVN